MGNKISICGKGGSGKSSLTALLAQAAKDRKHEVLVIDSDESNSGLFRTLGFKAPSLSLMDLVGGRKTLKGKLGQPNILRQDRITISDIPGQYKATGNSLHMVAIGKINHGLEGCACPMGVLCREFLKKTGPRGQRDRSHRYGGRRRAFRQGHRY